MLIVEPIKIHNLRPAYTVSVKKCALLELLVSYFRWISLYFNQVNRKIVGFLVKSCWTAVCRMV